jgi:hypothetical protein
MPILLILADESAYFYAGKGICDEDGTFVLKHILVNKGEEAHLSGLREAYFGKLLQGSQHVQAVQGLDDGHDHITRFVEVLAVCVPCIAFPFADLMTFCKLSVDSLSVWIKFQSVTDMVSA